MVMVGGATRLTQSGLSMVEWAPIMGVVPPLSAQQWNEAFDKYQQFPEYRLTNWNIGLQRFKRIYLMEYGHRMLGRLIALVFVVPLLYFLIRKRIGSRLAIRLLFVFLLGGLQGLLGWYMVQSGLVDIPRVSAYRLAAHLGLALLIYAYILWVALGILVQRTRHSNAVSRLGWLSRGLTALILLMVLSGGFMVGTKAGFVYNSFPQMNGQWVPDELVVLTPRWRNLFENVATIQFAHRVGALLVVLGSAILWLAARRTRMTGAPGVGVHVLLTFALIQMTLGILTLVNGVPVLLAAAHQVGALCLLTAALCVSHLLCMPRQDYVAAD